MYLAIQSFILDAFTLWTIPFFIVWALVIASLAYDYNIESPAWTLIDIAVIYIVSVIFVGFSPTWNATLHFLSKWPYLFVYFAIGLVWSVIRFQMKTSYLRSIYLEAKRNSGNDFKEARNAVIRASNGKSYPIKVNEYKGYLFVSVVYWPFSIVGLLLGDFLRQTWTYLFNKLSGIYSAIAHHSSKEFRDDKEQFDKREAELNEERRKRNLI